jgi:hypothetical protein
MLPAGGERDGPAGAGASLLWRDASGLTPRPNEERG